MPLPLTLAETMSLRLSLMGSSASGLSGSSSRLEATEWLEAASDMASKLSDVLPMLPSSWLRLKRVLFSPVGPRMEFSSELTVAFPWLFRRTELWVPWIKMERLIKRQWGYVHAHKVQSYSFTSWSTSSSTSSPPGRLAKFILTTLPACLLL